VLFPDEFEAALTFLRFLAPFYQDRATDPGQRAIFGRVGGKLMQHQAKGCGKFGG
jgi:hypothetical protein